MTSKLLHDFEANRENWLRNPLTEQWDGPQLTSVLSHVDTLLSQWKSASTSPFSPDIDAAALDTAAALRDAAGGVWFNNGILAPDEAPDNWPFHLKALERGAVAAKAARVGLSSAEAAGYACSAGEAHEFCIRAARQEILLRTAPSTHVTVVAGEAAHAGVQSAAEMLGVPLARVRCGGLGAMELRALEAVLDAVEGAVVVVATWRSARGGGYDDVEAIAGLLRQRTRRTGLPALLHLDAVRCFDDSTTLASAERARLGLPEVRLGGADNGVHVATVAAGGINTGGVGRELAVALKPRALGGGSGDFVEYVEGCDSTVSGSRDAFAGALVALHEARFGSAGFRRVHQHCRRVRDALAAGLAAGGIPLRYDARGLDLVIEPGPWLTPVLFDRWRARRLRDGAAMLAVQPAATLASASRLLGTLVPGGRLGGPRPGRNLSLHLRGLAVPGALLEQLRDTVAQWRSQSARSCGYPGNHSTLSVLGPVIGHVLATSIPPSWVAARERELLDQTCAALGLNASQRTQAVAAFTSGSTKSNRVGILTALSALPHATLYASAAAHYSVAKIAADHSGIPRVSVIPTDELGRMVPQLFGRQLAIDRRAAAAAGRPFAVVLLASYGTTFTGAIDDLPALHDAAARVGCRLDYIHLDGALDLGASMAAYTLGPPGAGPLDGASGRLVVQGVSVSQHKFPGLSVAGQVVCWAPPRGRLAASDGHVDPRAVFELWLYRQLASPADSQALHRHCLANAQRLRDRLRVAGTPTLFNPGSLVTLVQRPPPWLVIDFNLAPEAGWVHFITMPHVGAAVVDGFAAAVAAHRAAALRALAPVRRRVAQLHRCAEADVCMEWLDGRDESLMGVVAAALYGADSMEPCARAERTRVEWTNGALCFAALGPSGALLAALLVRVAHDRVVEACAVLLSGLPQADDFEALATLFVDELYCNNVVFVGANFGIKYHDTMAVSTKLFINNEYVDGKGRATFTLYSPYDESIVADNIPIAGHEDVDAAVDGALSAYHNGPWASFSAAQRAACMIKLADLIDAEAPALARLESMAMGQPMPIGEALVASCAQTFRYYAGWADKIRGETYPAEDGLYKIVRYEPLGVCAGIGSWNSSHMTFSWKVAPALAAGNTVIYKSSEKSPLGVAALGRLVKEAGFPPGVVQILSGDASTGELLAAHMKIVKISFTGSKAAGKKVQDAANNSNMKRCTLELGGKSPAIVFDDAPCSMGFLLNSGQVCATTSRIYVQAGIAKTFIPALKAAFEAASATLGPVADRAQYERVAAFIDAGKREAELVTGGGTAAVPGKRFFVEPTLFANPAPDASILREEIFGPVATVSVFDTEEEVVKLANDTTYGLSAAIYTESISRALRVSAAVEADRVEIQASGTAVGRGESKDTGKYKLTGNCRKHHGGCKKHKHHCKEHGPVVTSAGDAGKYSIKGLGVMSKLPPELQIRIASQLDPRTIFSLRHADSPFKPLWDSHKDQIILELRKRYSVEAAVFPEVASLGTTNVSQGLLFGPNFPQNHYFLFLQLIREATESIAKFLIQDLSVPADYAEELPSVIVLLWRLFGSVPGAPCSRRFKKQEVFTYFHSLSKQDRMRILELFNKIGVSYFETHGFDYVVLGQVPAWFHTRFKQTYAYQVSVEYFAMEWMRDGMKKVWNQVSRGQPAEPKSVFRQPWDWKKAGYPEYHQISNVVLDPWTYEVGFVDHHIIMWLPPSDVFDMLKAFKFAAELDREAPLDLEEYLNLLEPEGDDWKITIPWEDEEGELV
ncbi:pyridoxal phosphate-dependent transferase [Neofusicoccum parvum]|nr:pyridoxal phosphate-dependent transferase [Neofusicoccum parvum]